MQIANTGIFDHRHCLPVGRPAFGWKPSDNISAKCHIWAAAAGFVGILIVTRPSIATIEAGQIAAALAAVGFAGSAVFTRRLTRTETITSILFWLTVMQAAFGLICAGYDGDIALPSAPSLPWIAVIMANDRPPRKKADLRRPLPRPDRILENPQRAGRVIEH